MFSLSLYVGITLATSIFKPKPVVVRVIFLQVLRVLLLVACLRSAFGAKTYAYEVILFNRCHQECKIVLQQCVLRCGLGNAKKSNNCLEGYEKCRAKCNTKYGKRVIKNADKDVLPRAAEDNVKKRGPGRPRKKLP